MTEPKIQDFSEELDELRQLSSLSPAVILVNIKVLRLSLDRFLGVSPQVKISALTLSDREKLLNLTRIFNDSLENLILGNSSRGASV